MKNSLLLLLTTLLSFSQIDLVAQKKTNIKYGKISAADFDLSEKQFDTSVNAVVIADIGRLDFEANNDGWFSLVFKRHTRIKILNKNGVDAANIEIPLYMNGNAEEKVINLKASTYNLEGGSVVETVLDKKSVFKDKVDKNRITVKFTLPAVKAGSLIEYTYTVSSDFLTNLQPWAFQGEYPVLWSQYEVKMPEFFNYVFLSQGSFPLEHTKATTRDNFSIVSQRGASNSSQYSFSSNATLHTWVAKDVPVLKTESFTSTIRNHIAKIEFQLSQYRFPETPVKDILGNWNSLATELMKDEDFGAALLKNNNWLDEELAAVVTATDDQLAKAKQIYAYVRDRYTSAGLRSIGLSAPLKTISKNKHGYVADLNLLLTAMMKQQKIEAYPVILSTRSHGYTNEYYPLIDRFNYVICAVIINDKKYFLDASSPTLGFNRLPNECYNGHARMITPNLATAVYFNADSLLEKKLTTVFIRSDSAGVWRGHCSSTAGYYESLRLRDQVKEKGESAYFKTIQSSYSNEMTLRDTKIEMLKELEKPVKVDFDFETNLDGDIIYFNPMMWIGYRENFFKATERSYPVEMPYVSDETFVLNLVLPAGYLIEELPKSARVNFGDRDGFFEYLIEGSGETIKLRSRLKISRAVYAPEEYNDLREFFSYVVKKHAESIVLKRKAG